MPVQTTIGTVRHAHTRYNAEKRYAGTLDIPLSKDGVKDARKAASKLAAMDFGVIITSMQRRAYETAEILAGNKIPVVRNKLCNERKFGVMEGLTWDDIQSLDPPILMIRVGHDLHTVNPKGGEPFEEVWDRAKKFRRFVLEKYAGSNVLVVSHGVFLQMFHGVLRGLNCIESLARYPGNLELSRFRFVGSRLIGDETISLSDAVLFKW
ncbi:MAG: histidine phosphatase family protein [Candidatus Aminicenantes bacterium]|jgi:broad specificity phosphatase PhoE|nr:histidine phosphatase family protein [Candidatus Aminicenantes bacterium]